MSDLIPQVNDVWVGDNEDGKFKVLATHNLTVFYLSFQGGEADLCTFEEFTDDVKLIERDGKPYEYKREFEHATYYWVDFGPNDEQSLMKNNYDWLATQVFKFGMGTREYYLNSKGKHDEIKNVYEKIENCKTS